MSLVYPAAVTPFSDSGKVDYPQYARLLAWFSSNRVDGLVIAGTTGEGPSLSAPEKRDLLRHVRAHSSNLRYILGIATNSLSEAAWLCRSAAEEEAEAALVMPPPFYKEAGDDGLAAWFLHLMDRSDVPVMIYNFPKRLGLEVSPNLIRMLTEHPKFYGVKDSSGSRSNLQEYASAAPGKKLFVGDETLLVDALELGWSGTISGAANVLAMWLKAVCNDYETMPSSARVKLEVIGPALQGLRTCPQPFTNKEILTRIGILDSSALRLPLRVTSDSQIEVAWNACREFLDF